MNEEKRWIGIFSALLLLLGIFVGIAMDRFLFRPPPPGASVAEGPQGGSQLRPRSRFFLERLISQLDLTDEQRREVEEVFQRNIPRLRAARGDRESFRAARRQMHEELGEVLTAEQMQQLEELRRRERRNRPLPGGAPPGAGPGPGPPPAGGE